MKFSKGKKIIHFLSVQFAFIFRVFFLRERERVAVKEDITRSLRGKFRVSEKMFER